MTNDTSKLKIEIEQRIVWAILASLAFLLIWQPLKHLTAVDGSKLQLKAKAIDKFAEASNAYTAIIHDAYQPGADYIVRKEYQSATFDHYQAAMTQLAVYFDIDEEAAKSQAEEQLKTKTSEMIKNANGASDVQRTEISEAWGLAKVANRNLHKEHYEWMAAARGFKLLEPWIAEQNEPKKYWSLNELRELWERPNDGGQAYRKPNISLSLDCWNLHLGLTDAASPIVGRNTTQAMDLAQAGKKLEEKLKDADGSTIVSGDRLLETLMNLGDLADRKGNRDWEPIRQELKSANQRLYVASLESLEHPWWHGFLSAWPYLFLGGLALGVVVYVYCKWRFRKVPTEEQASQNNSPPMRDAA